MSSRQLQRGMSMKLVVTKENRKAPAAFKTRPRSLKEISDAGDLLGMDVLFEPQYQWIAEEFLAHGLPTGWKVCHDADSDKIYYWNEMTQQTSWQNPAEAAFKTVYNHYRGMDEAKGVAIFALASRAANDKIPLANGPNHGNVEPEAGAGAGAGPPPAGGPPAKNAARAKGRRRSSVKWSLEDSEHFNPMQLEELAEYVGIKMRCAPEERECHLLGLVGEYLDKTAQNFLPQGWVQYTDDSGYPYYYHNGTGESTYDYPVVIDIQHKVKAARKSSEEDEEQGPDYKGTQIDRFWAFADGKGGITYVNMKTREAQSTPPPLGARATTLVQKRVRGFLARLRMRTRGKRKVIEAGGIFAPPSAASWQPEYAQPTAVSAGAGTGAGAGAGRANHASMADESAKWHRESAQRLVKASLEQVIAKYNESIEFGGDGHWTMHEYDEVLTLLKKAQSTGLLDKGDEFKLKGAPLVKEVKELVSRFEEAEGRRRAERKRKQLAEERARQMASKIQALKDLQSLKDRLIQMRELEFTEAVADPSLNGKIIRSTADDTVSAQWQAANRKLGAASSVAPSSAMDDMDDEHLSHLLKLVAQARRSVESMDKIVKQETKRRKEKEYLCKIRTEDMEKRRVEAEIAAAEAAKKAEKDEQQRQEEERRKRTELEAKLKRDYEQRIQQEQARRKAMEQEHLAMESELQRIREERERREAREKEELDKWNLMTFASEQDRDEVMAQQQMEAQRRKQEEEKRRAREEERKARLKAQVDAQRQAIAEQQNKIQEQLAAQRAQEEEMARKAAEAEAAFEEEKRRREAINAAREEAKRAREEEIARQRAMVDESDSDTEEEKQARESARKVVAAYPGDVFAAARDNDVQMLKQFFLVQGSKLLLNLHSKGDTEGGRTLVHMAAWWGCEEVLDYLLSLGATVNVVDTMFSRTTPLMEAVRAGRRNMVDKLLAAGADIGAADYSGDTALHWAARRGWGTLLVAMLRAAERAKPHSTRGLVDVRNARGKTAGDVAANDTIRELIIKEMGRQGSKERVREGAAARVRRGLFKAKMMGANVKASNTAKASRMRYGRRRQKLG